MTGGMTRSCPPWTRRTGADGREVDAPGREGRRHRRPGPRRRLALAPGVRAEGLPRAPSAAQSAAANCSGRTRPSPRRLAGRAADLGRSAASRRPSRVPVETRRERRGAGDVATAATRSGSAAAQASACGPPPEAPMTRTARPRGVHQLLGVDPDPGATSTYRAGPAVLGRAYDMTRIPRAVAASARGSSNSAAGGTRGATGASARPPVRPRRARAARGRPRVARPCPEG